ncbi:MAG: hypothetical protein RIC56_23925 [Pseudomonadales bacterium]
MNEVALAPRIIFSVIALASAIGPMIADFNRTHATNPLWTPHARFHVVWQVLTQAGVATVTLYLIWGPGSHDASLVLVAAILNYVWGGTFFATLASMPLYEGALKDVNGIKPFRFNILGRVWLVDTNLFGCTILMALNTLGVYLLLT